MLKKRILLCGLAIMTFFGFTSIAVHASDHETTVLTAFDANGNQIASATGIFHDQAALKVENDPSKLGYGEIGRMINPDYTTTPIDQLPYPTVLDFGVTIAPGSYEGKLELSFDVGNAYNGMDAKVITMPTGSGDEQTIMTVVNDGKVTVMVENPSLSKQTPFVVGLPKLEQKQPKPDVPDTGSTAPVKTDQALTLSAKVKTGWIYVKGDFSEETGLNVKNLSKKQSDYKKLASSDQQVTAAYSLDLKKGKPVDTMQVIFPLKKSDAGKRVIVEHLMNDGSIVSSPCKVKKDGSVVVKTTELGSFMIKEKAPAKADSTNQQYLLMGGGAIVVIVLLGGILIGMIHRRRM